MTTTLESLIKAKTETKRSMAQSMSQQEQSLYEHKLSILQPILDEIQPTLEMYGMKATMHEDKAHRPCPAIHIDMSATRQHHLYDTISEIGTTSTNEDSLCSSSDLSGEKHFFAGACNKHPYRFRTHAEVIEHIAESISNEISFGSFSPL